MCELRKQKLRIDDVVRTNETRMFRQHISIDNNEKAPNMEIECQNVMNKSQHSLKDDETYNK